MDVRDVEPEVDSRGSRNRRERLAEDDRLYESDAPQPGKPWGFFLVLSAIVVVAVMYLVTMRSIPDIPPETAVGAMSGALALIGTLVGTYFGIKAGLDGQEKVKASVDRAIRGEGERRRGEEQRRNRDQSDY